MGAQKCVNPEKNNLCNFFVQELKIYYLFDFLDNRDAIYFAKLDNANAILLVKLNNQFAILFAEVR